MFQMARNNVINTSNICLIEFLHAGWPEIKQDIHNHNHTSYIVFSSLHSPLACFSHPSSLFTMAQKVVLKVLTMTDDKTKKKSIEAVADIYGVDSIETDVNEQKLTVIGEMDTVAVVKKLKKVGKVDIVSVGPAVEEKKEEKKEEKEEKKEEKQEEKK
ncbi:heavy metal-associated isoprenylated plant protein 39-like isoform X2 [Vicia villosa]|uniref:heavy metal-associated isoprenylated plant protein 39-like isoform X2 n=1 Tax=Vicia villosa TaxID=3911 RepID=UPI00273CC055|nr:heavy metal-associated isoprenylated plant protein 39-like isoform X2 [Vicia villosa]